MSQIGTDLADDLIQTVVFAFGPIGGETSAHFLPQRVHLQPRYHAFDYDGIFIGQCFDLF